MKTSLHSSAACVALMFAAGSVPALAQNAAPAPAATDADSGVIVVTAQKRSENVQSVPLAVSVLSGQAIAAAARPSVESAAQLVPSLNFLKSGTTLNQTIFLRGVGTASFSIAGEPSVSTVVDGVVFARSGEAFSDLIDIAQLEVLRGPQGTLFGKNASAGVLNITTVQPKHTMGGSVEASYFDRNEFRLKGTLNLPLGTDLAARMTGFYGKYDGNIFNNATGGYVNGYKHYGGRVQVLYDPSSALRLYFTADYHQNDDNCCADIIATGPLTGAGLPGSSLAFTALPTPLGAATRTVNQNLVTSTKEKGYGASFQADVAVGTHTLTSITAYRKWDNTEIRDGDWLDKAYVGFNQLHDFGPQKTHTFTQELRLTSQAKQFFSYVLGAYYSNAFSERVFTRSDVVCTAAAGAPVGVLIPCGGANANPSTFPTGTADFGSTFKNFALFGQATANFTDKFRAIGGLRYSHDELNVFHSRVTTLTGPGIQPNFDQGVYDKYLSLIAGGATGSAAASAAVASSNGIPFRTGTKNDNLSGKLALQYDLASNIIGYGSYTRGYKGPAYNVFYNLTATGTNVIAAETSDAFEVGLKSTMLGGKATLNLAAFYAKYHNFQANNPDLVANVVVSRFTNAGDVITRGFEADFSYRPVHDLSISGGVAYTDAYVDMFLQAPGATATQIIPSGTPLGFAPAWKGSVAVDYRWRMNGPVDLFMGAQGNFQSSQLSLFSADPVQRALGTIPAYGLVNLSLGVGDHDDKYRLTFQVRNALDMAYPAAIINGGPGGSYRYQIPRDASRYWGVTGRVSF